jgi:hypothetical protein
MYDKKMRLYSKGSFRIIYVGVESFAHNKIYVDFDLFEDGEKQKSIAIHMDDWNELVKFIENERQRGET